MAKNHTSDSCTKIKDVHKYKATRRNTMSVSNWNKGWGGWQDGTDDSKNQINLPTNVKLVVLDGCRPTKSKPTYPTIKINPEPAQINPADAIVVDSGASGIYFSATSPVDNLNTSSPQIRVGTASAELSY